MKVRHADEADARRIAEIHVSSWQAAYRGILPDSLLDGLSVSERERSWSDLLGEGGDGWLTLVAESSDRTLVGFCSVAMQAGDREGEAATPEIGALYVDPGHWREGAGSALLLATFAELQQRGDREVALWVLPENEAAHAFYERFGFEIEQGVEKREERSGRTVIRLRGCPRAC